MYLKYKIQNTFGHRYYKHFWVLKIPYELGPMEWKP